MNISQIVETLAANAGRNIHVEWERDGKKRAAFAGMDIRKRVSCAVRGGINFENLRSVRDGIENGERDEVGGLPWGEWAQFPIHITHKGADYVRLYPASGFGGIQKPNVEWTLNSAPVSFAEVQPYLLASELPSEDAKECFNIKAESVKILGR